MSSPQHDPNLEKLRENLRNLLGQAGTGLDLLLFILIGSGVLGILHGYMSMTLTGFFVTIPVLLISFFALVSFQGKIAHPVISWSFVAGLGFDIGRVVGLIVQIITYSITTFLGTVLIGVGTFVWIKKRSN